MTRLQLFNSPYMLKIRKAIYHYAVLCYCSGVFWGGLYIWKFKVIYGIMIGLFFILLGLLIQFNQSRTAAILYSVASIIFLGVSISINIMIWSPILLATISYNSSACAKLTLYRLPYYVVLFIFYIFVTFVISNADFYAFVKNKNLWGKNIQYGEGTKQVKSTIDDLFSDLDSDNAGMQYDYERAIRRSFSYGVENPVSVLFASLLMMAGDGEAELKKNEIRYSSESLMKRKTKLDRCVRDFLNIFHAEYIQERPGWISIRVREILEELESNNEFTLESLDTVLEKTTKIMSSKKVHMSIKERKRGKVLRNRSVFSSGSLQMISLDEMVRSVDKRRLNPEKLFEFLYLENAYRSMREVVYTPSNGDYTVYDRLYAALCIKAVESSNKKKRNSNNSKKDIDYDMFSD